MKKFLKAYVYPLLATLIFTLILKFFGVTDFLNGWVSNMFFVFMYKLFQLDGEKLEEFKENIKNKYSILKSAIKIKFLIFKLKNLKTWK